MDTLTSKTRSVIQHNLDSRALFLLNRRGLTGIEGRKRDVNRAGDLKSDRDRQIFKKSEKKISPGAEVEFSTETVF